MRNSLDKYRILYKLTLKIFGIEDSKLIRENRIKPEFKIWCKTLQKFL